MRQFGEDLTSKNPLAHHAPIGYPGAAMNKVVAVISGLIAIAAMAFASQSHAAIQTCYAQAFCPQTGRTVACRVYADPFFGQSCTYEYKLGYGVRCTGWDVYGGWVVFEDYCVY